MSTWRGDLSLPSVSCRPHVRWRQNSTCTSVLQLSHNWTYYNFKLKDCVWPLKSRICISRNGFHCSIRCIFLHQRLSTKYLSELFSKIKRLTPVLGADWSLGWNIPQRHIYDICTKFWHITRHASATVQYSFYTPCVYVEWTRTRHTKSGLRASCLGREDCVAAFRRRIILSRYVASDSTSSRWLICTYINHT